MTPSGGTATTGTRVRFQWAAGWSALIFSTLIAIETARDLVTTGAGGGAVGFASIFQNLAWWVPWAAFTPLVAALCRRSSFFDARRFRAAVVHATAASLIAGTHVVLAATVFSLAPRDPSQWPGVLPVAQRLLQGYLVLDLVTYAGVVAGLHAIEYAAILRRRETEAAALAFKASELERALTTARLEALRAQLNPHFLFNTLNSIAGLVRRGDREQAVTVIARLGELLRESLTIEPTPLVPLAVELAVLDRYIAIEEVRFADRLRLQIEVPPTVADALVPSLLLQPLVENAVRHGIARWAEGGTITIIASAMAPDLRLTVENRPTVSYPATDPTAITEGIGLRNTRERLVQHFGGAASVALRFLPDGGCVVDVRLPFRAGPAMRAL